MLASSSLVHSLNVGARSPPQLPDQGLTCSGHAPTTSGSFEFISQFPVASPAKGHLSPAAAADPPADTGLRLAHDRPGIWHPPVPQPDVREFCVLRDPGALVWIQPLSVGGERLASLRLVHSTSSDRAGFWHFHFFVVKIWQFHFLTTHKSGNFTI